MVEVFGAYPDEVTAEQVVRDAYSSRAQQYIDLTTAGWPDDEGDTRLVQRYLTGLDGAVLDLGCGPGHWTARLRSWGVDAIGIDMVPEFITYACAAHPASTFRLGSMTDLETADHSVAGVLSWYSTIHLRPGELDRALTEFRRVLATGGVFVVGFFDSEDGVAAFDHKVVRAYRWPVDLFAEHLVAHGFVELQRRQHQVPDRPDRRYAALAARAV